MVLVAFGFKLWCCVQQNHNHVLFYKIGKTKIKNCDFQCFVQQVAGARPFTHISLFQAHAGSFKVSTVLILEMKFPQAARLNVTVNSGLTQDHLGQEGRKEPL